MIEIFFIIFGLIALIISIQGFLEKNTREDIKELKTEIRKIRIDNHCGNCIHCCEGYCTEDEMSHHWKMVEKDMICGSHKRV